MARRVLIQFPTTGDVHALTGRTAEMVALILTHAATIDAREIGCFELHFTQRKIRPLLREQLPPVDLGETA